MLDDTNAEQIRRLNDCFRQSLIFGGQVLLTEGVCSLSPEDLGQLLGLVRQFDAFTDDNDPHREHDFGAIDFQGSRYFWKLDYYDLAGVYASPEPADPTVTHRVITIMLADEY